MAYGDFKDLAKRSASETVLRDKAFNIAKNMSCFYGLTMFWLKNPGSGVYQNEHPFDLAMKQVPKELHKPIIRIFKRRTVYFSFKCNIWCVHLADMQLIWKDKLIIIKELCFYYWLLIFLVNMFGLFL